jgi:hypothetical protein
MIVTVIDDGESVRLIANRQERIGDVMVTTFGQSRDGLSLPVSDADRWQSEMLHWAIEEL